jgi:hypothetical protein
VELLHHLAYSVDTGSGAVLIAHHEALIPWFVDNLPIKPNEKSHIVHGPDDPVMLDAIAGSARGNRIFSAVRSARIQRM